MSLEILHLQVNRKKTVRMSKGSFEMLCAKLKPYLTRDITNMTQPITVHTKVAAALYYLTDEGHYQIVANTFGLGRSTVSIIIREVCFGAYNF